VSNFTDKTRVLEFGRHAAGLAARALACTIQPTRLHSALACALVLVDDQHRLSSIAKLGVPRIKTHTRMFGHNLVRFGVIVDVAVVPSGWLDRDGTALQYIEYVRTANH